MDYAVRQDSIWKAIKYENDNQNQRYLKIDDIQIGYDKGGLFYQTGKNLTYDSYEIPSGCPYTGQFRFDVRCRFYYQPTMNNISIAIFDPQVIYNNVTPYLGSIFCQRRLKYQNTNPSDDGEIYSLLCITLDISQIQNYFTNLTQNSVAKIVIDPRKLTIVYDSQQKITSVGLNTLYKTEIDLLENISEVQNILENIQQMSQFVLDSQDSIKELSLSPKSIQNTFQYNRNGTEYFVSQNLITVIDKVPKRETLKKINPSKKFQLKGVFIYLDLISKQQMTQYCQNLTNSIEILNNEQIYCCLSLLIILIGFKLYYSIILGYQILYPIAHLTNVLKQIQIVNKQDKKSVFKKIFTQNYNSPSQALDKLKLTQQSDSDSYNQIQISFDVDQDFEGVCFSQDTQELLFIFQNMFQILLSINKNFFSSNESSKLLEFNKQLNHFENIKNYNSLGVCYNNIGVIHYNNQRYQESIINFQKSIIYANYELNVYSHNNSKYNSSNKHKSENQNIKYSSKQNTYLEYLNFQQEGEDTYNQNEIQELYENLYNRKLNLVKALFHFYISYSGMWDIFQEMISDLLYLTKNFLGKSNEREMLTYFVMLKGFYFSKDLSSAKDTLNILTDLYSKKFETNDHQNNKNKQEYCQFQNVTESQIQNKEYYADQIFISPIINIKKLKHKSTRSKKIQNFFNYSHSQEKDQSILFQELKNQEKSKDPLQIKENFFETQNNSIAVMYQYKSKQNNSIVSNDKNQLNLEESSLNTDTYYNRPKVSSIFKKILEHKNKLQREENNENNLEKGKQENFHQKFMSLCQKQYVMQQSRAFSSQYPQNRERAKIITGHTQDKQTKITFYKLYKTLKKTLKAQDYEFSSDIYFYYYALSQAQYQIYINNQYTAATILTNCFEKCKQYLPYLKLQALNMLHRIFSQNNIKEEYLEQMKKSYEQFQDLGGCVWINTVSVLRPYF
ncbi:YLP motif protein (macronuclear) [Tetrahymena thermophila SB210]|uniref:YLP motif protein n=1 Tax=Tetrahymena thermophila (strain SB210) TaxID=312017 RepID=Q245L8_TETTS|nr:YLP motif protein [Tetrahymena thermophila SB210]EAS03615.2 YLP motif protein [Tetrahymena thermophila SB210]|eukprot:XP_001023860.2 YLP motif protein [Tetrahymena thermophila SB210]